MQRNLFVVLACLLFASHGYAASPYINLVTGSDVFYESVEAACTDPIPQLQADFSSIDSKGRTVTFTFAYVSNTVCYYSYVRNDGVTGTTATSDINAIISRALVQLPCVVGDTESRSFQLGREEKAVGDASFVSFGNIAPNNLCLSGCNAVRSAEQSSDFFAVTDPASDLFDLIYANIDYTLDGAACSTSSNPPAPTIPPPPDPTDPTDPDDGGDTGGGDTGGDNTGGDTGGGDTGGDNTGGDTGGGDTGGGTPGDGAAVTNLACGELLSCTGDAIQCAVLRMQKQETCTQENLSNFPKYKDDIESFLDNKGESAELDEGDGEIDISQLFTGSTNTRFLPAACPPPKNFSLTTAGGRTFELTYEPLCQLAIDLSYLIVIAASIFYAVYVGRSAGGE